MAPTKLISTRSTPLLMRILPLLGACYLAACFAAQSYLPVERIDLVDWIDSKQAIEKSRKLDKPILYYFTAQWCPPCRTLKQQVFADKQLAKEINQLFVPVQVTDRTREDGANSLEVDHLQKKYKVDAFPTLIVVKAGRSDIRAEKGFKDKQAAKEFIRNAFSSSIVAGNPYEVDWQNLDEAIVSSHTSKVPLLILFWDERSESARYEYLANKDLVKTIKANFVAAEVAVPTKADAVKSEQSKQLLQKLAVRRAPALVIVPIEGAPHFQIGNSSFDDNKDFLEKYLRFSK